MATDRTKCIYEILIRFDADGFRGAHVKDLETIMEDGEVLVQRETDPRPATLEEVGQYLGKESAKLIEAAAVARAEAGDATSRVEAAEAGQKQAEAALDRAAEALRQA